MKEILGYFNGQNMVGEDGKVYPVTPNYASKSRLVEGDGLKLTITDEGQFLYKKVRTVPRKVVIAKVLEEDGKLIFLDQKSSMKYRVLLATINFFQPKVGDEAVLIVPKEETAGYGGWAAVEGLITTA